MLYYGDANGEVRYRVRADNGTWSLEIVDSVGFLFRDGIGGRIALKDDSFIYFTIGMK